LQKMLDQHASAIPDLSAQLAQSKEDYDALLTNMATYLNAASDQIEAAEGVAAAPAVATEAAPGVAGAAQPIPAIA
ncbi:hypothetical protein, partial [Rhodoblastus acidophilus]|uniref:hypothetical protein n=1 Tax=Rhodoblastus acidophilus TaxID=1074 RepID=UPI0019D4A0A2